MQRDMDKDTGNLPTEATARYVGPAPSTFAKISVRGDGPPYSTGGTRVILDDPRPQRAAAQRTPRVDPLEASNGRSVTSPGGNYAMPDNDPVVRLIEQGRGLNSDDFVRMLEGDGPIRLSNLVSINDLAVELGVSIRTLRRWNKHPDAPKRYRRGRRLMYRRADVRAWFQGSEKTSRAGDDARDEGTA